MNKGLRNTLISVGLIAAVAVAVNHAIDSANPAAIAVATELYDSCLVGFTQAQPRPSSLDELRSMAEELDKVCAQWSSALLVGFHPEGKSSLTLAEHLLWFDQRNISQAYYIETLSEQLK